MTIRPVLLSLAALALPLRAYDPAPPTYAPAPPAYPPEAVQGLDETVQPLDGSVQPLDGTVQSLDDAIPVLEDVVGLDADASPAFRRMAVMHAGRPMPLDTFARLKLLQYSGRQTFQYGSRRSETQAAVTWLARLMFAPETTWNDKVFLVEHPEVVQALGLEAHSRNRYSMADLQGGFHTLAELTGRVQQIEPDHWSPVDREVARLQSNLWDYMDLLQAFAFARPSPDFAIEDPVVAERTGLGKGNHTYLDIYRVTDRLDLPSLLRRLEQAEDAALANLSDWPREDQAALALARAMFTWTNRLRSSPFPVFPRMGHDGEQTWLSPGPMLAMNFQDPSLLNALGDLQTLRNAWVRGDADGFEAAAARFNRYAESLGGEDIHPGRVSAELRLERGGWLGWTKVLYLIAFCVSLVAVAQGGPVIRRTAVALLVLALIPHTGVILSRMYIMQRPPVTNLYATFLFVAWVCVLLSLFVEFWQRNGVGSLASSLSGAFLVFLAGRYFAEGDTMGQLVAVLDSNFWLSTHVLTITMGYAGCWLAGIVAHVYLILRLLAPHRKTARQATFDGMMGLLAFGLCFSFLGTMLGGVWADQSWGRFWGWDPKENGALLIVLFTAWIYHARLARWIGSFGAAIAAVLGTVVVMVAWLGTNLLGEGLHSYGFTTGQAWILYGWTAFELLFVGAVALLKAGQSMAARTPATAAEAAG